MKITRRLFTGAMASVAMAVSFSALPALAQDPAPIRVAMGDIASVESLGLLVAMERTKERGVPMELTFFNSEDVATQAVVGGQADIGVGAPYAFIQNSNAPIRMFYRMTTLLFFPVVNSEVYTSWDDLDGQEVTVHSRGSGTEALMRLMEDLQGITFSNISYVPGAEVRAGALLQGTINASIVDAASMRLLETEAPGKFVQLPVEGVNATDEALYANVNFLETRSDDLAVFVEELIGTWQEISDNPEQVAEWREQYDLLPDLPAQATDDIAAFYVEAVEGGVLPLGGGTPEDAIDDLEFLAAAGQVEEPGDDVDVSMYWDFTAVDAARQ
ncbi:ABC transporter substrate-binding protein [Pelagibacterium luteolum]|uniref:NitT/TauT family transport system substrate-binding protein n=1 Tax=Pelagibacterium luteolum TaxID=440168 RepID=A0A1G7RX60_9HYPH|nr:ABC transporter substrate-binding protein [Pelagibacterium luteolum]SDG14809.1 NitT/TauT family transport system substrate-binding protein [Pelagibacterium luteolum]